MLFAEKLSVGFEPEVRVDRWYRPTCKAQNPPKTSTSEVSKVIYETMNLIFGHKKNATKHSVKEDIKTTIRYLMKKSI